MPVQDLTPELRTRLSQVERAVGWFVIVATLLLVAGFAYYVYHTAERKGWFKIKVRYNTVANSGAGLHIGDPVMLMGFDVGQITHITAMPPYDWAGNVYLEFSVQEPYYGYIWDDSKAKISTADFLGKRTIEVLRGGLSGRTNVHATYKEENHKITGIWGPQTNNWVPYTRDSKGYTLVADESPALGDRLETVANQVQEALPHILALTNQLSGLLTNVNHLTLHADSVLAEARPVVTNLAVISTFLTNANGSLGQWLIPTNLSGPLQQTLGTANTTFSTANATLANANTNIVTLGSNLNLTLENLANITSNLNAQVQSNGQIVKQVSDAIVHADEFVQGLKRHWLFRSAFKNEKQKEPERPQPPERSERNPMSGPKTGKRLGP
jgi:ABC-type transporter Mla subunit MlaD